MSRLLLKPEITEEVIYPESDGEPMGETDTHRDSMVDLIEMLKDRYRDNPNVYVSGDLFIYYRKGDPSAVFSPDAFVIFGVPKRRRRTYKTWLENGKIPDVVFEVSSDSTSEQDEGSKKALCRRLGVREYYLYDPDSEYLYPALQGFRLIDGKYVALTADPDKGLYSELLDLYLRLDGYELRLFDGKTGERLLTPQEAMEARREAEAEVTRLRAELERLKQQG